MAYPIHLFEAYGIEIEYMLVARDDLSVLPICDRVLEAFGGGAEGDDVELGTVSLCNELALHVIELKTTHPARSLAGLAGEFQETVARIGEVLAPLASVLLPGAMHPWMDPLTETRLWANEHGEVYRTFDRIFDCLGHGWSNLQSTHINLPFAGDAEFRALHAAVRCVLPLLPAIAASSPMMDGRTTDALDNRLRVYATNSRRIPSVSGRVIPECATNRAEYERVILDRIYTDLAPHDPEGILRHEWVNARGAIARFDRGAVEIRVLDVQECPRADLALAALIIAAVRALAEERWVTLDELDALPLEALAAVYDDAVVRADAAMVTGAEYLACLGLRGEEAVPAADVWRHLHRELFARGAGAPAEWEEPLTLVLERGPLARRLLAALGPAPDRAAQQRIYRRMAQCLEKGELFQ